ncbi:MAG: hypothetical protein PHQ72_01940 [Hespellia sp.]|jgi:hypothetical protein|nr:hypothetical protein [Hespellia sp.]
MLQNITRRFIVALTLLTTVFMLNQAEAKAWWSCMYPTECFEASIRAVVYEDGERKEKEELTQEDYQKISVTSSFKVKWYFLGDGHDEFFGKTFY